MMTIALLKEKAAILKKENIALNQKSWPEMAKHMGTKRGPRHPHLTDEHGLTEYSISAVKDKYKHLHNDPYAKRKHSDKCT